jgi:hypothetical protein
MSKYGNLKRRDTREDGMIFWGYTSKGNEWWLSQEKFNDIILKVKERDCRKLKEHKKKKKIFKMGDISSDGMVFLQYSPNSKNGEIWLSGDDLVLNRKVSNARKRINSKTDKSKKNRSEYEKKRKSNDILFKLSCSIRTLICGTIKTNRFKKDTKTEKILSCSVAELKAHLESQFLPGMSWENRSEWHIDHIMPVSMAKTYDDVVRLNHYKNLRPLWAEENLRKSDKIGDTLVLF